jgi:hypothetical protein
VPPIKALNVFDIRPATDGKTRSLKPSHAEQPIAAPARSAAMKLRTRSSTGCPTFELSRLRRSAAVKG